jgi:RNA recognition motif-containing protein
LISKISHLGPIKRVSIPKDEGRNRTYGFIEYKHLESVNYALNIFAGTKLFGRELVLKNRNANANRAREQAAQLNQQPNSLVHGYNAPTQAINNEPQMPISYQQQQLLLQQQLFALAQQQINFGNAGGIQMFPGATSYDSTRADSSGSHRDRDNFVDRNRHHRHDRSNRGNPYRRDDRRSRSNSPPQRNRDRSPDRNRSGRDNRSGGYHRWGKR